MGSFFGTDGVRGIANIELTADLAFKLGRAGAYVLTAETHHVPRIIVGMDTRISGDMLESALVAGICSVGAEAVCLGVVPTPAIAYLARHYGADAGVVISASHNPFEFNGIKFFNGKGYKLSDSIEQKIESLIHDDGVHIPFPSGGKVGRKSVMDAAAGDYVEYAAATTEADLEGIRILADCANGAAYRVAPLVFEKLGADAVVINNTPNGININRGCGSTHILQLQEAVRQGDFDIGLAFDGDADRVLAVDENGSLVDGDVIMAIAGIYLKKMNMLKKDTVVTTVMSNMGFDLMARREGINVVRTSVGDRYVLEEMVNNGYVLGGEQSGHVILLGYNTTGDGIITAIQLLTIMKQSGSKLSELAQVMKVMPQVLKNARVSNRNKSRFEKDEFILEMKTRLETEFGTEGRVLIRPSGTEPLVRVMIEGTDPEYINEKAVEFVKVIEERLG